MSLGQIVLEALESLNSNKLRSGLTVLGIVIGVAAVIAMLAVGNGAQASITGSINDVGTNLLFVFSGARDNENVRNPRRVTLGDAAALLDTFARARAGGRTGAPGNGEVVRRSNKRPASWGDIGIWAVRNISLLGPFISDDQDLGHASVVIIGVDVADKLFGHRDGVIGETGIEASRSGSSACLPAGWRALARLIIRLCRFRQRNPLASRPWGGHSRHHIHPGGGFSRKAGGGGGRASPAHGIAL
jgi:hypothetical protein